MDECRNPVCEESDPLMRHWTSWSYWIQNYQLLKQQCVQGSTVEVNEANRSLLTRKTGRMVISCKWVRFILENYDVEPSGKLNPNPCVILPKTVDVLVLSEKPLGRSHLEDKGYRYNDGLNIYVPEVSINNEEEIGSISSSISSSWDCFLQYIDHLPCWFKPNTILLTF